jgi:hypothetical protein
MKRIDPLNAELLAILKAVSNLVRVLQEVNDHFVHLSAAQ